MKKEEFKLQCDIAKFITIKHPDVMFRSDLAGIKMTKGQAFQIKRLHNSRAYPDMHIIEQAIIRGVKYNGLFIEIKLNIDVIYKKNGEIRISKHIQEQHAMLLELQKRGYLAK
jgi:hypothetical protein